MFRRFYELSQNADQDIDEIFNYTQAEYGFDQAVNHLKAECTSRRQGTAFSDTRREVLYQPKSKIVDLTTK